MLRDGHTTTIAVQPLLGPGANQTTSSDVITIMNRQCDPSTFDQGHKVGKIQIVNIFPHVWQHCKYKASRN